MKNVNKWMISTIVISVVSVISIGLLFFRLMNQPKMEMPNSQQMPENGEMPSGGGPGGGQEDGENSFRGQPGTEQSSESSGESDGLT